MMGTVVVMMRMTVIVKVMVMMTTVFTVATVIRLHSDRLFAFISNFIISLLLDQVSLWICSCIIAFFRSSSRFQAYRYGSLPWYNTVVYLLFSSEQNQSLHNTPKSCKIAQHINLISSLILSFSLWRFLCIYFFMIEIDKFLSTLWLRMFLKLILDTVSVSADCVLFSFPDGELFNRLRLPSLTTSRQHC